MSAASSATSSNRALAVMPSIVPPAPDKPNGARRGPLADAVEVVERELVEALEPHATLRRLLGVERLGAQRRDRLAGRQRGLCELVEARVAQGLLDLGVRAERLHLLAQDQVVAHAAGGR